MILSHSHSHNASPTYHITRTDTSAPSHQDSNAPDAERDSSSGWDVPVGDLDGEQGDEDYYASDSEWYGGAS